jgi:NADPH:quinone reductase-like Zn-dependent oxidoreductase
MKAAQFASYGGPEVLRFVEVSQPHAGPGQVRIAVRAAGGNGLGGVFARGPSAGERQ